MSALPLAMVRARFLLGPLLVALALFDVGGACIATLVGLGVALDVFDGVIARRLGVDTVALRQLDTRADIVFVLCGVGAVFIAAPRGVRSVGGELAFLLLLELVCDLASRVKFGRGTAFHTYLARVYGLSLFGLALSLLLTGGAGVWGSVAIVAGTLCAADVLLIVRFLPNWRVDVKSALHAYRRRGRRAT